jgi:hypothetical protein
MTALGQKLTFALQNSCPLYPQKRTCAVQYPMFALGQKRTSHFFALNLILRNDGIFISVEKAAAQVRADP